MKLTSTDQSDMPKMRVKSDRYDEYVKENAWAGDQCIPVDLYGKRVFPNKSANNLEAAGEDIKEFYDLEGDYGLEGGE